MDELMARLMALDSGDYIPPPSKKVQESKIAAQEE